MNTKGRGIGFIHVDPYHTKAKPKKKTARKKRMLNRNRTLKLFNPADDLLIEEWD